MPRTPSRRTFIGAVSGLLVSGAGCLGSEIAALSIDNRTESDVELHLSVSNNGEEVIDSELHLAPSGESGSREQFGRSTLAVETPYDVTVINLAHEDPFWTRRSMRFELPSDSYQYGITVYEGEEGPGGTMTVVDRA